ncbi:kinase-like domain-containing protein [Ilyonectria robusta]|uniref:kinase-like domain-containing protein n=1 Tax=Ilyonectria robusta TaxID=1079257 RepID=UPI001E8D1746|nr:kinase-like domain-containing protein [Ilyonectria robusta]KAH8669292.1 kinase-like domain-containing protein [Ilyonectria robusta]
MPRPEPHPLALFSLVPLNERANAVLAHQSNQHLVSWLKDGTLALDVGHIRPMSGGNVTLATLGRNGDVIVEGSSIAKIQCSFEIEIDTKVIMFYDRSHAQTSQVFGDNATPFEYGRLRKVVVQEKVNTIISMGGVGRNLVQFELKWHCRPDDTMERVKDRESGPLAENPRLARTIDEIDTVLPSRRETRIHTPGLQMPKTRYATIGDSLGSGQFGIVYKAVNLDTGKLMAVKIMERPAGPAQQEWMKLKREVEILSRISHDHIVDYISSQGWDRPEVEIFMGLKEGTLQSLIGNKCSVPITDLAHTVLHHMLQAIDCLAIGGIIHRDVKPENILYVSHQGQYHFQLGDFGFSHRAVFAATFAGSPLYMAPEMFRGGKQTHKVDVWSLYVTMLWTLDVEGFREVSKGLTNHGEAQEVILSAAATPKVDVIREMARVKPEERASAAQMLVKCYNGQGLTTPQNQIPPLISPAKADSKAPAAAARANTNRFAAAGELRVEKTRFPRTPRIRPIGPVTEKRGQALGPRTPVKRPVPGSFPGDTIDTSTEHSSGLDLFE